MLLQHNTIDYFREQHAMREYLTSLNDEALSSYVRYTTPEGKERGLWHCLLHVVNHGTQHRSFAAVILSDNGHSPGGLDFTAFFNEYSSP